MRTRWQVAEIPPHAGEAAVEVELPVLDHVEVTGIGDVGRDVTCDIS